MANASEEESLKLIEDFDNELMHALRLSG